MKTIQLMISERILFTKISITLLITGALLVALICVLLWKFSGQRDRPNLRFCVPIYKCFCASLFVISLLGTVLPILIGRNYGVFASLAIATLLLLFLHPLALFFAMYKIPSKGTIKHDGI